MNSYKIANRFNRKNSRICLFHGGLFWCLFFLWCRSRIISREPCPLAGHLCSLRLDLSEARFPKIRVDRHVHISCPSFQAICNQIVNLIDVFKFDFFFYNLIEIKYIGVMPHKTRSCIR